MGDIPRRAPEEGDPVVPLYRALFRPLCERLTSRLQGRLNVAAIEDGVQDAFLALSERYRIRARLPDRPEAWLLRVAWIRTCREFGRRLAALPSAPETLPQRDFHAPLSELVEGEKLRMTREALSALDPDEQRLVEARIFQGRSHADVAAELGLPEETVRKACQRALRKIRLFLGGYSSTYVGERDSLTYAPRSRRGAIAALRRLPAPYGDLLADRYLLGLTDEAISGLRGVPLDEVRAHARRGEELLEQQYGVGLGKWMNLLRE